jgi:hypothetical protein
MKMRISFLCFKNKAKDKPSQIEIITVSHAKQLFM